MHYPLVVIYRANCPPPVKQKIIVNLPNETITLVSGSIKLSTSKMQTSFTDQGTVSALVNRDHEFPKDTYIIIEIRFFLEMGELPYEARTRAALRATEIATLIETSEPALLTDKIFEDVANLPGKFVASPEGPMTITARPSKDPDKIAIEVQNSISKCDELSSEKRAIFQLSSRWFQKGIHTLNEVDRFLSMFIVLEVYPACGSTDVPGKVCEWIKNDLNANDSIDLIKEKLALGRITGLRADIVHNGISMVSMSKVKVPSDFMHIVEILARLSISNQLGQKYNGELDKWLT